MGNALDAAKFSVERGNTGVGDNKELFKGLDDFSTGVKTWKENIDSERLKLKTDTAQKYREAEKDVYDNLPSDKTDKDLALKALASYKDQLYSNMNLVKSGMIKPEDNLIFQENGKQSFNILANQINSYAERREEALQRAKGFYTTNEKGEKVYQDPISGKYEASLQDLQSRLGNPEFSDISFGENGMGRITFYKTTVDEDTGTRVLVKDDEGKPIPIKGLNSMSVLSFDRGRNQKADRLDLQKNIMSIVGPDTALGQTFEKMSSRGLMQGTIEDNQRQNPQLKVMIEDGVSSLTSTPDRIVSILSDNGLQEEQSQPLNMAQWADLTDAQKKETISYTWIDSSGKTNVGTKSKYIQLVTSANGQIVPKLNKNDIDAAENVARTSIYSALKKDITSGGTKRSEWDPNRNNNNKNQKEKDLATFTLIDQVVGEGNQNSLEALVRALPNILSYKINNGEVIFSKKDGTKTAPIKISGDIKAVDVGKSLAAELMQAGDAQLFTENSKYKDGTTFVNKGVNDFTPFRKGKKTFQALGALTLLDAKGNIKYGNQIIAAKVESKMAETANALIARIVKDYDGIRDIKVDSVDEAGFSDTISIIIDGVKYSNTGYEEENREWLNKSLNTALKGGTPSGKQKEEGRWDNINTKK